MCSKGLASLVCIVGVWVRVGAAERSTDGSWLHPMPGYIAFEILIIATEVFTKSSHKQIAQT